MEKKKYKLLVIGPANRHIENFIDRVKGEASEIELISNKGMNIPEDIKVSYTSFSLRRITNFFSTTKHIRNRIKAFKPDVIHIHEINSVALLSIIGNRTTKVPTVISAWGSDILVNPEKSKLLKWLVRRVLKKGTAFTSDSVYMANRMRELLPEKELTIEICNFGVHETDLALNKEKIIYSNRMHNPLYRIDAVIDSFASFIKESQETNWRLIIAGRGSETESLKKQVLDLGIERNVEFVGFLSLDENNGYYAKASIFISIPESDATAMSLLEAMYYGCFPVLSDLPANREWIQDGVTGLFVKDLEDNFIQQAIHCNLENAAGINRARIINEATISISTEKFANLHRKVI
ncbi:MAG: glycosyltransferase [Crocinitomicaceae bacterium]|nr:glycosyltransferase [Crocinitomicaceae bacterium]